MPEKLRYQIRRLICLLECSAPIGDLLVRIWVANVFWKSGLTKMADWSTTLYLFEYEYSVPVLSPAIAACLGTGAELVLPIMLVFGLAGRAAAGALFVFNIVAVISYPGLSPAGLAQHQVWGILLLIPLMRGPGRISIDYFIRQRFLK